MSSAIEFPRLGNSYVWIVRFDGLRLPRAKAGGEHYAKIDAYLPFHSGLRFSANAFAPSRASSDVKICPM